MTNGTVTADNEPLVRKALNVDSSQDVTLKNVELDHTGANFGTDGCYFMRQGEFKKI